MTAGRNSVTNKKDWGTPRKYIDSVREVLGEIHLDPCSNEHSIVNAMIEYRLPYKDGLKEPWDYPTIYVNPPYGRDKERGTTIKDWIKRCYDSDRSFGSQVLALIPVATNTSHWKEYIWRKATAICFLYDIRLKFLENGLPSKKGAPMSCCMVYWGWNIDKFKEEFDKHGAVIIV